MALVTYADLQSAVTGWLARDTDTSITARVPDFITLFELVANRRLRLRLMETQATLTPSAGIAALPSDYLTWRRLQWTGSTSRQLQYVHPGYLKAAYPTSPSDVPRYFTIEGANIEIMPLDTSPLTLDYFQKIPALSLGQNWLMTTYPDVYLFGSLAEAYGFQKDPDNMGLWASRRDQGFDEIEKLDQKTRGPSNIQVMGWTP